MERSSYAIADKNLAKRTELSYHETKDLYCDRMATAKDLIRKIQLHENLKYFIMQELDNAGISCQEQDFMEDKGDILVVKAEDVPKAIAILKNMKENLKT